MNTQDAQKARDNLAQSAIGGKQITPGTAIGLETRAIYVGVSGDLVVTMANGETVTLSNLPVGFYPLAITLVVTSGTTATNLVAFY